VVTKGCCEVGVLCIAVYSIQQGNIRIALRKEESCPGAGVSGGGGTLFPLHENLGFLERQIGPGCKKGQEKA
jgi:hypothetical protein